MPPGVGGYGPAVSYALLRLQATMQDFVSHPKIWADGAYGMYGGELIAWVKQNYGWDLEIVEKPKEHKGFVVVKQRWVVERTFAWLGKCRRLSKDYEQNPRSSEAWVYLAMIGLMVRRLA